jgi:preprotein translocase subunit SecG
MGPTQLDFTGYRPMIGNMRRVVIVLFALFIIALVAMLFVPRYYS